MLICVVYSRFFHNDIDHEITESRSKLTEISVNRNIIDVGKIDRKELAQGDFFIKNIGQKEFKISKVDVSCSCSSVAAIDETILPNDSIKIVIQYNENRNGYFFPMFLFMAISLDLPRF